MSEGACPFCDLGSFELVAENSLAVAFRDGFPVNPGHTLIIPRRHVATWRWPRWASAAEPRTGGSGFDASREEQLAILELADRVKADLDAHGVAAPSPVSGSPSPCPSTPDPSTPGPQSPTPGPCSSSPQPPTPGPRIPDGYNLGINVGEAAGQTVMHLHLHVIPRFRGDTEDPRGGIRWMFPDRARYWDE